MYNLKELKNIKSLINKNIIYYLLSYFLLVGFGYGKFCMEKLSLIQQKQKLINDTKSELSNLENQINVINNQVKMESMPQVQVDDKNIPVKIYVSPYMYVDLESAGFELIDKLMQIFQVTGNKVKEISFINHPAAGEVGSLTVNLDLITSYTNLEKILSEIYTWEYLAGIKSIKLESDINNYVDLKTQLIIDLYVKKDLNSPN